ncbi:cache domain-containing protein [Rhizobium sp. EC-SD404]|uniref:cache domain-containing protein n=1 Tax=Rhizobium sp. EC-SD404 TaxID=2038389 RepID=UPI00125ECC95|nr:cache domain-containing protein [Rhizobium sp. EC-SD404]
MLKSGRAAALRCDCKTSAIQHHPKALLTFILELRLMAKFSNPKMVNKPHQTTGRTPLTLARAIYGFVLVGAFVATLAVATLVRDRVEAFNEDALATAVATRAAGLELAFARGLHEEWENIRQLAETLAAGSGEDLPSQLAFAVGDGEKVSWAGYAAIDGTVLAASNGLLEGVDVGQREWFQRGLEGPFAGDVHEAVLLASLLPDNDGEPLRFLDLATPVRNANGDAIGVLGFHLNFAWAQDFITEQAAALDIHAFLMSQDGSVVIATDGRDYATLNLQSTRRASAGMAGGGLERWPDGQTYFTNVVPQVAYEDLPSFGWRLIARIDGDAVETTNQAFSTAVLLSTGMFGVFLILLTALFVQIFIRPFDEISKNAIRVADGEDVYPYESRRTAELARLSAALARLQGRS